jgi:flagellar biosynthesis/type III secretory pathway chaperone
MVNVDKEVNAVIDILKKEQGCYKDILELSRTKNKLIIEGKVAELDKIVKLEQSMIFNIGQLERKREEEVAALARVLNLSDTQLPISELMNMLQPELRKGLEDIHAKLKETFSELKSVNDINGQLLEQSLEYIDFSINMITSSSAPTGSLYEDINVRGKDKQGKKNIFDTKV